MSTEIRNKNGKIIGILSDSVDVEDQFFIDGKKVSPSDIKNSKEIRDAFNSQITKDIVTDDECDK